MQLVTLYRNQMLGVAKKDLKRYGALICEEVVNFASQVIYL